MNPSSSLNAIEVAELLKITKNTVYELIKRGELPAYKVGRKLRVDREDVENYINKQKSSNSSIKSSPSNIMENNNLSFTNINTSNTNSKDISCDIVLAGQDIILDILAKNIEKYLPTTKVFRTYTGTFNGLYELYNGRVSISSAHLWDKESNEYNTPFVKMLLPGIPCTLINLAYRTQGLYVKSGNPKNITSWMDLANSNLTLVNREKGSGTRILLDSKLSNYDIPSNTILGYDYEEVSHLGVASAVSRGIADVGVGSEKVALQVSNIDFVPLQKERYDLVIKNSDLNNPTYRMIIDLINSDEFKSEIEGIGGYNLSDTGKVVGRT